MKHLALLALCLTGCVDQNGASKVDPAAVAIAYKVLDIGASEYARQHPVHRDK